MKLSILLFSMCLTVFSAEKTVLKFDKNQLENEYDNYLYEMPKICYLGRPSGVNQALEDLMQGDEPVLQFDQYIQAVRYQKTKIIFHEPQFFETMEDPDWKEGLIYDNPIETSLWLDYDQKSDVVLVLSDLGPQGDGTEIYATEIGPCKNKRK